MMKTATQKKIYQMYDYLGHPIQLQMGVKYKLRIKNGYILALRDGEVPMRVPNLLKQDRYQRHTA
ncbi:hypothetical protein IV38_GL001267 [Lactobacillus selangorensis]|uniref:Uncharacterized protein n=1 Tax=Lactobacillus selangorensis TaxID=81857 RepID=A0A0R2FMZ7_9LACO|nr:hypothetical protein [Lactobacillus selangorensis]KRN29051.1 hypothetical protein IV38_GL001267 [Lactobacillus selangorensis]KRN30036.1 hypothetical protein IV40_GL002065 [Lactobacillus selangorensis]